MRDKESKFEENQLTMIVDRETKDESNKTTDKQMKKVIKIIVVKLIKEEITMNRTEITMNSTEIIMNLIVIIMNRREITMKVIEVTITNQLEMIENIDDCK